MKLKHFGYDFKVKAETSGVMGDSYIFHKKNNTKINYKMGGLGAENILPVIAQSVAAEEKIIVLEEPERRAHPGLQAKMADLFVDCSVKNQFIIETHSEIEILAIGIGHDVSRYYKKAIKISDVQELGDVMIDQLSGLFENKKFH